jgi:hypothetical protein
MEWLFPPDGNFTDEHQVSDLAVLQKRNCCLSFCVEWSEEKTEFRTVSLDIAIAGDLIVRISTEFPTDVPSNYKKSSNSLYGVLHYHENLASFLKAYPGDEGQVIARHPNAPLEVLGWSNKVSKQATAIIPFGTLGWFDEPAFLGISKIPPARYDESGFSFIVRGDIVQIATYFGAQLHALLARSPVAVPADRAIPKPHQCIFLTYPFEKLSSRHLGASGSTASDYLKNIDSQADNLLRPLALSGYAAEFVRVLKGAKKRDRGLGIINAWDKVSKFSKVNEYLSSHLFKDSGYRVSARVMVLKPLLDDFFEEGRTCSDAMALQGEPALVCLSLIDGQRRMVDFHDVGSGIGFVLPVLAAVAEGGVVQVQQPELHLHPALQTALGDVLIDAIETEPKSTLIVETHSEHLVLRLLRRIREGANAVTQKGFSTEQVAVYYFDPSLADGTRIVRLRMTPMGDFIDRWPRGFFTDREQELFDA